VNSDRYMRIVLSIIAVALVLLAVQPWLAGSRWLGTIRPDAAQAQTAEAKYDVAVPKTWGKFVAYSNNNLLLEAPDGTLRIVDVEGRMPEYPKVKVRIRWQ